MISEYENKLIADVLETSNLAKLPTKTSPEDFTWVEAVAKIILMDRSVAYGIVKRNPDMTYRVTYVNGATSALSEIVEVYPYVRLDTSKIKKFTDKEDVKIRIDYLKSLNLPYQIDFENSNISELNMEIVKAALYRQINQIEE